MESPETAAIWAADPFMGREQALQVALAAEAAGLAYYQSHCRTHRAASGLADRAGYDGGV